MHWLERLFGPPLAAPETPILRTLRWTLIGTALGLAALVAALDPASRMFGKAAIGAAAGGTAVLIILVPVYVRAKRRADDAHFARLIERARR